MRLKHKTQRGGVITHTGTPLRPGETVRLPVDVEGHFDAPDGLAQHLLRVLGRQVEPAPEPKPVRRQRKEADS